MAVVEAELEKIIAPYSEELWKFYGDISE